MDLKSLVPVSDTVEVTIKDPENLLETLFNDDGTPMTITLYAPHTKKYKKVLFEQYSGTEKLKDLDFETLEDLNIRVLAKVTKSWDITWDGTKPDISQAEDIYRTLDWLKTQIEGGIANFQVFTKG